MSSKEKTRWNVAVVLTCLMLVGFVSTGRAKDKPAETRYTIVDLGAFNGAGSRAFAINNHGQVIGYTNGQAFIVNPLDSDGDGEPDTWFVDDGMGGNALMIGLGTLLAGENGDSSYVYAFGINDSGQVVGFSTTDDGRRAFILTPEDTDADGVPDMWNRDDNGDGANDLMVNLGNLPLEGNESIAYAISNSGYVCGKLFSLHVSEHGFIIVPEDVDGDGNLDWFADEDGDGYNDLMIDLGKLQADDSVCPYDVSDSGQVVGRLSSGAFLVIPEINEDGELEWFRDAGGGINSLMIKLEALTEDAYSSAYAINSSGQIVGSSKISETSNASYYAVIWEADTTIPTNLLGDIKGYSARADGINDSGQVVGYGTSSHTSSFWAKDVRLPTHTAFIWEEGATMTPLTDLIEEVIEADDLTAVDINNLGQIVGEIGYHAYIAVPIP